MRLVFTRFTMLHLAFAGFHGVGSVRPADGFLPEEASLVWRPGSRFPDLALEPVWFPDLKFSDALLLEFS